MEVHHSHHGGHKKKIQEYLLEFIMLFVAVTLGFFAENLREHTVTQHKLKENYESIVEDLRQDSAKIQEIFDRTVKYEKNMVNLKYLLFQYHNHQINWEQLKNNYRVNNVLPTYATLFINNTTFKNMQSSGLLSYIEDKKMKAGLSYYYEVVFKRLEDNNKLFDQAGVDFFQKEVPRRRNVELYFAKENLLKNYPEAFSNKEKYTDYLLNLDITKSMLTSEKFVYQVDNYSVRYYNYQTILFEIQKKNSELIKLIENQKN